MVPNAKELEQFEGIFKMISVIEMQVFGKKGQGVFLQRICDLLYDYYEKHFNGRVKLIWENYCKPEGFN